MPQASASDRVDLLRETIAHLEGRDGAPAGAARTPSGHAGLDRFLAGGLARGALHDVHAAATGDSAAAAGFALAFATRAARITPGRAPGVVWIAPDHAQWENGALYGPGLAAHGFDPGHLVRVRVAHARDALWALEEALRSPVPAAVVGEFIGFPRLYDLTASRRLLLAAQAGGGLGLLLFAGAQASAAGATSAAATRFVVAAARSVPVAGGGPGRAAWRVDLVKNRAGRTGQFSVEWSDDDAAFAEPAPLLRDRLPHPADRPATPPVRPDAPWVRRAG